VCVCVSGGRLSPGACVGLSANIAFIKDINLKRQFFLGTPFTNISPNAHTFPSNDGRYISSNYQEYYLNSIIAKMYMNA